MAYIIGIDSPESRGQTAVVLRQALLHIRVSSRPHVGQHYRRLCVGNHLFEQLIKQMYQIEGGRTPIFAIWIVGHLEDFGEDYPNRMKRLYNSFLVESLGTDPIEYQTMLRYIRLLAVEREGILVESDSSDHTV